MPGILCEKEILDENCFLTIL
uniref:Uncharacterized protein n=1 Tax=Romanomermis culicivorax TaxID=13658 RepID=A0A915KPP3_ROMCU